MTDMPRSPLRTLLVDDEPLAIERIAALCADLGDIVVVGAANNGAAALSLNETLKPDLILLDISMPEMDGLNVAKALSGVQSPPVIIFVTAFDNFAVEAFDTMAADYLLKPVAKERLQRAIERAHRWHLAQPAPPQPSQYATEFWVPHRSELVRVAAEDIEKVEAERDYMRLFVGNRSYLMHQTITRLEARLDPARFVRLHRSVIVRRDRVVALGHDGAGSWHAELSNGEHVRIGRTYLTQAKSLAGR